MAQKTLRQFSALSSSHIPTGLNSNQAVNDGFELKTGLVNMVQASPFCGKASEDANAHLQNFLEVSNTINPKGTTMDIVRLRLFPFSLLGKSQDVVLLQQGSFHDMGCLFKCIPGQILPGGQDQCPPEQNLQYLATTG